MKTPLIILLLVSVTLAQTPRRLNPNEFRALWTNSPFTTTPPPEVVEQKNIDWALAGIMRHSDGNYTITVINKQDRNDRRRLNTSGKNMLEKEAELEVLEVQQSTGLSYKESKVRIAQGGVQGWIEYDSNILNTRPANPIRNQASSRNTGLNNTLSRRSNTSSSRPTISSGSNNSRPVISNNANPDENTTQPAQSTIRRRVRIVPRKNSSSGSSGTKSSGSTGNGGTSSILNTNSPTASTSNSSSNLSTNVSAPVTNTSVAASSRPTTSISNSSSNLSTNVSTPVTNTSVVASSSPTTSISNSSSNLSTNVSTPVTNTSVAASSLANNSSNLSTNISSTQPNVSSTTADIAESTQTIRRRPIIRRTSTSQ